ncbi:hypothetical protein TSMEX_007582 [Taenia solium]|eukprot:TsM_000517900 transcript=TsM_000517900 gene=TsM_000517900
MSRCHLGIINWVGIYSIPEVPHAPAARFLSNFQPNKLQKERSKQVSRSLAWRVGERDSRSQLWCGKHVPEDVRKACKQPVKNFGPHYLDLYLIHFPVSFKLKEGETFDVNGPNAVTFEYHKLDYKPLL